MVVQKWQYINYTAKHHNAS